MNKDQADKIKLGDKVLIQMSSSNSIEATVVAIDIKNKCFCCARQQGAWNLEQKVLDYWKGKYLVIDNWKDFIDQKCCWFYIGEIVEIISEKSTVSAPTTSFICKECNGTGILDLGFYTRDCSCRL